MLLADGFALGSPQLENVVDGGPEDGFLAVQAAGHAVVLGSLAGQEQGDGPWALGRDLPCRGGREVGQGPAGCGDHRPAPRPRHRAGHR
ncbi:hypothetical protein [Streptomyces qinzhouensis]|uniref:hypothetical protein n=1 Tax=Streptomyces qinzhouensis TaxID=2599401 RepID=UPI001644E693|nr:hypothetical protein [Streptomyces qinzhouensis]